MAKKRNTKTKEMVKTILEESPYALCHEDVEKALDKQIDRVTIYRILQGFEEDGLVHRIADDNGKWHYAICHNCSEGHHHDNHIHFQCTECSTITCINASISKPNLPQGYSIKNITYLISGCCTGCQPIID